MTTRVFRVVKRERAATAFDGEGARLFGGRWNSKGRRFVYTSGSQSLAILEIFVHLNSYEVLARRYCLITADVPESICEFLDPRSLQSGWDSDIPINYTRDVGDAWITEARSAVLIVPSAISVSEKNYLLNPEHKDFARIAIGPRSDFRFSKRFLK